MLREHIERNAIIYFFVGCAMFIIGIAIGTIGILILHDWGIYLACFPVVGIGFYLSFALLSAENNESKKGESNHQGV